MTYFLLIRHGLHELGGGILAGRTPGVHLSPDGKIQVERLVERLQYVELSAIYSSPLDRTHETAQAIADHFRLDLKTQEEILELDFGKWQGAKIADLHHDERWHQFNRFRSGTRAPEGELMLETQSRIVRFLLVLRDRHPDRYVAVVSHADVIKSAVAYFLGVPLDLFQRIEISPASITMVGIAEYGPFVLCVNETGALPPLP